MSTEVPTRVAAQNSEARLRALLEVSQALAAPFHLDTILQLVVDTATKLLGLDTGALYLTDDDDVVLVATCPPLPPGFPDGLRRARLGDHPHIGAALREGRTFVLADTRAETLTPAEREVVEARRLRTILYVPLLVGTAPTGILILGSVDRLHTFDADDISVCHGFSGQAAQTIENARLYESTRRMAVALEAEVEERRRTEDALRESEERFRALFQQAGDYLLVLDPTAAGGPTIVDANDAACRAHGFAREELLGRSILDLEAGSLDESTVRAMMERLARGETLRFETLHRRRDGTTFPVEVNATLVTAGQGAPVVFSMERDITERKQSEEDRRALQARLTQADKMESIGRLAGGVAHDFNNMIQAILGHASFMAEDLPPDSPLRENLREIVGAAERSAELTRHLLAFARKQSIEPKVVDLNETVAAMLRMIRRLMGANVALVWQPAPDLTPVKVDPSQVDQLVANLCVNARDAIGTGAGRIIIGTHMETVDGTRTDGPAGAAPGDYVVLSVSDDGCGMDEGTRAHIFEPFFTTKDAGRGTGLGLATVHGIVEQNRGFITVSSAVGAGTTFRIHLPAYAAVAGPCVQPGVSPS